MKQKFNTDFSMSEGLFSIERKDISVQIKNNTTNILAKKAIKAYEKQVSEGKKIEFMKRINSKINTNVAPKKSIDKDDSYTR